jgi:hypothetical protein
VASSRRFGRHDLTDATSAASAWNVWVLMVISMVSWRLPGRRITEISDMRK